MKTWLNWCRARADAGVWGRVVAGVGVVALFGVCKQGVAQCGEWSATGSSTITAGPVTRMVSWDRDGDGPEQPLLVVGASTQVGDITSSLAGWDGTAWHDLRPDGLTQLYPLGIIGNDLLSSKSNPRELIRIHADQTYTAVRDMGQNGQWLDAASDGSVAFIYGRSIDPATSTLVTWLWRYDGVTWQDIPMDFRASGTSVRPNRFAVWNGQLVVTGYFDEAGGRPADRIARWDGDSWEPFAPFPGGPTDVAVGIFGGDLYATGQFQPHRWTGSSWEVPALDTFPQTGQWPPDGAARYVTYSSTGVYQHYAGVWYDGVQWQRFSPSPAGQPFVSTDWRNQHVVCGHMGGTWPDPDHGLLARFDTNAFVPMFDGLTDPPSAVCDWNGYLVVAGVYGAGGRTASPAVRWDGTEWHNIGEYQSPYTFNHSAVGAIAAWNGGLLLGQSAWPPSYIQGLWRLDGEQWARWPASPWNSVYAIGVFGGDPVVFGTFGSTQHLARWDSVAWVDVVTVAEAASIARVAFDASRVVVTGAFTQIGGVPADRVAAWDGAQWSGFGNPPINQTGLLLYRGQPAVTLASTCQWWDGSEWRLVPFELNTPGLHCFVAYQGDLVRMGILSQRWSPEEGVRALGNDEGWPNDDVWSAVVVGDSIYSAGKFTTVGQRPMPYIAAWHDTPSCDCDSIDFNRDGLFPDLADIPDFLSVFQGGVCGAQSPADQWPCNSDLDFNNDGLSPDTLDIQAFLSVFSGGPCLQ